MKSRSYEILKMILLEDRNYSIDNFAEKFNISNRSIRYDINEINKILKKYNGKIENNKEKGLILNCDNISKIKNELLDIKNNEGYYSLEKRIQLIMFYLLNSDEPLIINQFIHKLEVSRSTILKDLELVEERLKLKNLRILRKQNYGFEIIGEEKDIRNCIIRLLNKNFQFVEFVEFSENFNLRYLLSDEDISIYKSIFNEIDITKIKELVDYIEYEIGYKFSDKSYYHIYFYLALTVIRLKRNKVIFIKNELYNKTKKTSEFIVAIKVFEIINELFNVKSNNSELTNLTLKILSSGVSEDFNVKGKEQFKDRLKLIANQMIKVVEKILEIKLKDEELENGLILHLKPLINRLNYDYKNEVKNPLLAEIKNKYYDIFEATKYSMKIIEATYDRKVNEDEIAYIAMHFGAAYERRKRLFNNKKIATIVVCPNGLGTSNLLISKLKQEFDNLEIVYAISVKELRNNYKKYKEYDLIITTVNLPYKEENIIKISPILTNFEKTKLMKMILTIKDYKNERIVERYKFDLNMFYEEMKHHFILKSDEKEFKNKLFDYFEEKKIAVKYMKKEKETKERKGLIELTDNKIKIIDRVMNWEDAIIEISQVLINNGDIKEKYIDEIFNLIKEKGPYFIITPGVALVHSKPSDNVNNTSIGILISKNDIIFENNRRVNIIIMLTLVDRKSHLSALADILTIFENKSSVNDISNKKNSVEVIEYMKNKLNEC